MILGRMLLGLSLICGFAGCAPLPITYYMPSADHATIRQYRCDQAPPFEAVLVSGILKTSAFFDGRRIIIGLYPSNPPATIAMDTSLLQIEVNGQLVNISNLQYHSTLSQIEPISGYTLTNVLSLDGSLSITGRYLRLFAEAPIQDVANLVLHIPPIAVNGVVIPAQTVSFQRERKVRLRFLILNC